MSDIEASTQAETALTPDVAFNAHSAAPQHQQDDIMAAWKAAQEGDPVDYDARNVTPEQEAIEAAKAAKALKGKAEVKAEEVEEEAPEEEAEVEAEASEVEEEPEEVEEKPKGKKEKPEKLTQAESRALIEQRVELNKRFQRRDAQWQAARQEAEAKINSKFAELEPIQKAMQLFEAGDLDGFATTLGAITKDPSIKDWNTLNAAAINAVSNPMYKRMRQLERQSEERAAEMQRQAQAAQQTQAEQARQREIESWKASLADEVTGDDDPAIGNLLAERPEMVNALFNIQQQHYHSTGGDLPPSRESAQVLLRNIYTDFKHWEKFKEEHADSEVLQSILAELELSGSQAAKPATKQTGRAARVLERQTTKKTSGGKVEAKPVISKPNVAKVVKNVSQAQTASASAVKPLNEKQLFDKTIRQMEEEWRAS